MKISTNYLTRLSIFIALTISFQLAGLPQLGTGIFINFMLFVTTLFVGISAGLILGSLTPWIASLIGQLPPILVPMIPFIMTGNAILVIVFGFLDKKLSFLELIKIKSFNLKEWLAVFFASLFKFIFLTVSVKFLLRLILDITIAKEFAYMMMFPQFMTAFLGGIFAIMIIKLLLNIRFFSELIEKKGDYN